MGKISGYLKRLKNMNNKLLIKNDPDLLDPLYPLPKEYRKMFRDSWYNLPSSKYKINK